MNIGKLSFHTLRAANAARLPQFKNSKGQRAHSKSDGSDWSPAQWLQAVMGELGEYANIRKKYERGDIDAAEFWREAKKELADVQIYLDILAFQLNIDLGKAVE
jgi:NTP pyrophosphatase (non-canonical NTP hydrolase)